MGVYTDAARGDRGSDARGRQGHESYEWPACASCVNGRPLHGDQEEIPFCAGRRRRVGLVEATRAIYDVGRVLHRLHIGTGSPFRARRHLSALSSRHWPPSRLGWVASDAFRTPRSSRRPFSSSRGRTQGHLGVAPSHVPRYATRCIRSTASTIDSDLLLSVPEAPNHCTKPRPSRSTSRSTK